MCGLFLASDFWKQIFLKILYLFLFLEKSEGREKERERETSMCGCLSHAPRRGPGLQPRQCALTGNWTATICFVDQHSTHWDIPARTIFENIPIIKERPGYSSERETWDPEMEIQHPDPKVKLRRQNEVHLDSCCYTFKNLFLSK